jgi:hypothetical protein
LADHKDDCADRYKTTAEALLRLGDKADLATAAAVNAANDAKTAAVNAANDAKNAVSDLERRLQKWLIALLLAVVGTAISHVVNIPPLHWG